MFIHKRACMCSYALIYHQTRNTRMCQLRQCSHIVPLWETMMLYQVGSPLAVRAMRWSKTDAFCQWEDASPGNTPDNIITAVSPPHWRQTVLYLPWLGTVWLHSQGSAIPHTCPQLTAQELTLNLTTANHCLLKITWDQALSIIVVPKCFVYSIITLVIFFSIYF